jgi:hypothetical protein
MKRDRNFLRFAPSGALLLLLSVCSMSAEPARFSNARHVVSAVIPAGWKHVPETRKETALKLGKDSSSGDSARIAIMTYAMESAPAGFDIWNMSNQDIQRAGAEDGKTVLKYGRATIDGIHMVWSLGRKKVLQDTSLWQWTYEGLRGSDGITIQLTVGGDEKWFAENEAVFAGFIKALKLSVPRAKR